MRQYPDSHFCWIGMDSEVQSVGGVYDGIRLDSAIYYSLTEEAEEQYPYLMLDHISEETTEQLQDRFGEMNVKGLWAIGLYGEISKDDFLTMVEKGEITYANIKDVKISVLAK